MVLDLRQPEELATVFTKKEDRREIGMRLIRLSVVQHDIMYKTMEATFENEYKHLHPTKRIRECTLFWNSGCPSEERNGPWCLRSCRDDVKNYNPSADKWNINFVSGSQQYASQHVNGKWIVKSNYEKESPVT